MRLECRVETLNQRAKAIELIAPVDPISGRVAIDCGEWDRADSPRRSNRAITRNRPERIPDEDKMLFDFRLFKQRLRRVAVSGEVVKPLFLLAPLQGPFKGLD